MNVDRSRFLAFVAILAAGACGPGNAPPPTTPAAAPSSLPAASSASSASAPTPLPSTSSSVANADKIPGLLDQPGVETGLLAVVEPTVDTSGCDGLQIGPCGEGGTIAGSCRAAVRTLEEKQRPVYLECVKPVATKVKVGGNCDAPVAKCQQKTQQCEAGQDKLQACSMKIHEECERTKPAREQQACWDKCLDGIPKNAKSSDLPKLMQGCGAKCGGELGSAIETCRKGREEKECKTLQDADEACWKQEAVDCKLPQSCWAPLGKACEKAWTELAACQEKAEKIH
jgi:hypothetical protein